MVNSMDTISAAASSASTSQILLVLFLFFLLVFALPMYRSKTGKDPLKKAFGQGLSKLFKIKSNDPSMLPDGSKEGNKVEPHLSNGTLGELRGFVADLARMSVTRNFGIVAPGSLCYDGRKSAITAFIIREDIISGLLCLGHGGKIFIDATGKWIQHINGEDLEMQDPFITVKQEQELCSSAFLQAGINKPVEIITIFISHNAAPIKLDSAKYFKKEDYRRYLCSITKHGKSSETVQRETLRIAELANIKALNKKEFKS